MQAEQTLIAANAQIGAAKAQYFPTISLTGALGSASTQLSDLFKGPAGVWSYGGSIVGPIFTGGAIAGQVAQAEAAQRAALASYEAAIQNAFADVENALAANANLASSSRAAVRALSSTRLARLRRLSCRAAGQRQLFPRLNLATLRAQLYGLSPAFTRRWAAAGSAGRAPRPMAGGLPAEHAGAAADAYGSNARVRNSAVMQSSRMA
jgi:multidrug efflux system outer membrane protein